MSGRDDKPIHISCKLGADMQIQGRMTTKGANMTAVIYAIAALIFACGIATACVMWAWQFVK